MSCYHPMLAVPKGDGSYSIFSSSNSEEFEFIKSSHPGSLLVPCGRCIGCRLDYSRSWADRMMLELETSKKAVFATLTYDNEHVPVSIYDDNGFPEFFTVDKRDCQLFMKRLRRHFPVLKIRFFLASEYGPSTLRPHYHAILFGIGLEDFHDLKLQGKNELGQNYYISEEFTDIWQNGFTLLADVSWKTCAYVSRYITKKLKGQLADSYAFRNCSPEFSLMSRKPGIGREYLDMHPDCLDFQSIDLSTPVGGLKIPIPKYYLRQLTVPHFKKDGKVIENPLYNPEKFDMIKLQRREFSSDRMLLKLQKTGLGILDYLEVEENKKLDSVKALDRSKVV